MTEKTLVLGFIFLIDHDSEDGAANGSDDSGSDHRPLVVQLEPAAG